MSKTHYQIGRDKDKDPSMSDFDYEHQSACGYIRGNVTSNGDYVDCILCLKSEHMHYYHLVNDDGFSDCLLRYK